MYFVSLTDSNFCQKFDFNNQNTSVLKKILCDYKTFENFADETIANPTSNSMLIVRINIESLQKNFDNSKQFLSKFKADVDVISLIVYVFIRLRSKVLQSLWLSFVFLQFKNKSRSIRHLSV